MARFEAVFYEGEVDERLPSWDVVEWLGDLDNGSKFGRKVKSFFGDREFEAVELARVLQEEYNQQFAAEFA